MSSPKKRIHGKNHSIFLMRTLQNYLVDETEARNSAQIHVHLSALHSRIYHVRRPTCNTNSMKILSFRSAKLNAVVYTFWGSNDCESGLLNALHVTIKSFTSKCNFPLEGAIWVTRGTFQFKKCQKLFRQFMENFSRTKSFWCLTNGYATRPRLLQTLR